MGTRIDLIFGETMTDEERTKLAKALVKECRKRGHPVKMFSDYEAKA